MELRQRALQALCAVDPRENVALATALHAQAPQVEVGAHRPGPGISEVVVAVMTVRPTEALGHQRLDRLPQQPCSDHLGARNVLVGSP